MTSSTERETTNLNVELPIAVYRFATGNAKLSGMKIKDYVHNALIEYGKKLELQRDEPELMEMITKE